VTITREPEIRSLPPAAADDDAVVTALTGLINEVYRAAEEGLWVEDATRTTAEEVAELTRAGQIAVARLGGRIAGCIRIQRLDGDTSEFGMLAAAPGCRGFGVGRALVRFAEQYSRDAGRDTMQLELLVPREWSHPSKEFLADWYNRIGYKVVRTGTIDEAYPNLAPLLATPCDFVTYQKDLRA
jgi:ribosomal protein S18 acetylase RimI-like enzyme